MKGGLGSSAAATVAGLRLFERLAGPARGATCSGPRRRSTSTPTTWPPRCSAGLRSAAWPRRAGVRARHPLAARTWASSSRARRVQLSTPDARRVLPEGYSREDAVFNLQRALLLVHALEHGDLAVVGRRCAIAGTSRSARRSCRASPRRSPCEHPSLLGVCLSGSGPSVLALATGDSTRYAGLFATSTRGCRCPARCARWPRTSPERCHELLLQACGAGCAAPASRRGALRLRPVPRAARGHLRLRRHPCGRDARRDRRAAEEPVALPRAAADRGRAATGFHSGFTPLIRADRLAQRLGVGALHQGRLGQPSDLLLQGPRGLGRRHACRGAGVHVFACASTGNLANSVSAHAARLGLECYVFIPDDLEPARCSARHLPPACDRRRRQLRRREPAVHADRRRTAGALRTSTCAPTTRRAPRRTASRSPSSSAGASHGTSCARSRAARCCRASAARSRN